MSILWEESNYATVVGPEGTLYLCGKRIIFPNGRKEGKGFFTCGCDLFRISMMIDGQVRSSIAGYGSSKRCWLGDQKCGLFRMVVRGHFKLLSFFFFRSSPCHETFAMHGNAWLMFVLFHPDNLIGGFGCWLHWHFKERGVFTVGNCQAHALNKYREHCKSARIYGENWWLEQEIPYLRWFSV